MSDTGHSTSSPSSLTSKPTGHRLWLLWLETAIVAPVVTALPTVFVGSSAEREKLAVAVKDILQEDRQVVARYWRDVFKQHSGASTIEVLVDVIDEYDFGVFILAADDIVTLRGQDASAPRDNVIFELGLFIGRVNRDRTFVLAPDNFDTRLPSDLAGVGLEVWATEDSIPSSAVRAGVTRFKERILRLGPRVVQSVPPSDSNWQGGMRTPSVNVEPTDGWISALDAGVLPPVNPANIRLRTPVVHPVWGFGRVIEVGPPDGAAVYLSVWFADHGSAQLRSDGLFLARFTPDDR